jgi:hypothetical protein
MKCAKRVFSVLCAVMMLLVNAAIANAASTDESSPTVISFSSGSTVHGYAVGTLKSESESIHYYRFTLGTTSSYADVMAVYLTVPDGCNYQVEITDVTNGVQYTGLTNSANNDKVIKIPKPSTISTYNLKVYSVDGVYSSSQYSISIGTLYKTGTYTGSFTPTKLTNGGQATLTPVYSDTASINLKNNTTIPDTAEVTEVKVSGTLSYNIGNTWMEIVNSVSGLRYEARLTKGSDVTFAGLRNSYETVKAIWSIDYYTYAGMATTYSKPKITIDYRYDQYSNFS